jgi:hypothetical protein
MSRIVEELIENGVADDDIARLLDAIGGLPVYVPQQIGEEHPIARHGGGTAASVLSALYGGSRIVMPLGAAFRRERLRRRVFELRAAGLNHCEIARRLGMHLRQVQRIASGQRTEIQPAGGRLSQKTRQTELDLG